jgi:NAD(P)-dependent dehydrogenase (short-subunit alcohol dehydrogenase family)
MQHRICLITGASDGLGLAAAHQLATLGLELILVGRNRQKLEAASREIRQANEHSKITLLVADLSSQQEIRKLSEEIYQRFQKLDILINNAGAVFANFGLTSEGIERTISINHFNYFLLTRLLLDLLRRSHQARIINVASKSHFQGNIDFASFTSNQRYHLLKAYAQSKLANMLFTYELAERLKEAGITVNAISPGRVRTLIGIKNQPWYVSFIWSALMKLSSISAEQSAKVYVYLATHEDVAHTTGKYFDQHLRMIPSSRLSHDKSLSRQLWEESERMTGLPSFSLT